MDQQGVWNNTNHDNIKNRTTVLNSEALAYTRLIMSFCVWIIVDDKEAWFVIWWVQYVHFIHVLVGIWQISSTVLLEEITIINGGVFVIPFYYMANPVLGKSLCSDLFFLGQDFAVRTVSMKTVQSVYFCFEAGKFKICNKDSEKKKCENCHSSHWNYQQKPKRLKFFRNFKDGWRRRTFFKCKPSEVHFTIRKRVPYNKLLTNRACSGRTGEYWPSVVFVRTSLRSVRTVTTSGQYYPVRPSRSVSKRLVFMLIRPIGLLAARLERFISIETKEC